MINVCRLSQFESPTTDIVLLGHSMGGLLGADVALLGPFPPGRHRILGHVSFDTPFIGIHPGVIKSGLASLFMPGEKPPADPEIASPFLHHADYSQQSLDHTSGRPSLESASMSTLTPSTSQSSGSYLSSTVSSSSYFTPPNIPQKKTGWQSGVEFWKKHQGGVRQAALAYVNGHLEFGGALLDAKVMRRRHEKIKILEKADHRERRGGLNELVRRGQNNEGVGLGVPSQSQGRGGHGGHHHGRSKLKSLSHWTSVWNNGNIDWSAAFNLDDNPTGQLIPDGVYVPRVRFLNYYTVSTGRIKRDKSGSQPGSKKGSRPNTPGSGTRSPAIVPDTVNNGGNVVVVPTPVVNEHGLVPLEPIPSITPLPSPGPTTQAIIPPPILTPEPHSESSTPPPAYTELPISAFTTASTSVPTPVPPPTDTKRPIHDPPQFHPPSDATPNALSAAEAEHAAELAAYEAAYEADLKKAEKESKKRERTFCIIPRDEDTTWVKVMMENVDEVGAHCGLFFVNGVPGEEVDVLDDGLGRVSLHDNGYDYDEEGRGRDGAPGGKVGMDSSVYERLLGDVTGRIEQWCRDWVRELAANPEILGHYLR